MVTAKAPSQTPRIASRGTRTPGFRAMAVGVVAKQGIDRPARTAPVVRGVRDRCQTQPCRILQRPPAGRKTGVLKMADLRMVGHKMAAISTAVSRTGKMQASAGEAESRTLERRAAEAKKEGSVPGATHSRAVREPARRTTPHVGGIHRTVQRPAGSGNSIPGGNLGMREGQSRAVRPFTPPSGAFLRLRMMDRPPGRRL